MNIGGVWKLDGNLGGDGFSFISRGLGLVLGPHVQVLEDEHHVLFLEGHFFGRPLTDGLASIASLENAFGNFCFVRLEKATGSIDIGTDRTGLFPLYHAFEDGRLIFGTTLNFVKANLRNPTANYEAWEELFVLGEVIGDKSTVLGVERLRYGTRISIDNDKVRFVRYWTPEQPDLVDDATYIRNNNALLEEALALTVGEARPKVVMLSGGEDSRRIALGVTRAGIDASFMTQRASHQGSFDVDTALACEVAKALGKELIVEPLPDTVQYVADWKTRNELLGFECTAHEWLLPLIRRTSSASIIYDGIHGGGTINGHFFKEFPQAVEDFSVDALATMICAGTNRPWLGTLRKKTSSSLVERVRDILSRYPESPYRINWFYTLHHTRRKIAFVSQLFGQHGHWTCYPFDYYPLFIQCFSADPKHMRDRLFQRECMAALAPEIASIPTTRGEVPPQFLTEMADDDRKQRRALRQQLIVSEEALELLPMFRTRYRILNRLRSVAGGRLLDRYGWFFEPASRFSSFLTWLKDKNGAVI
ncbi:MAG: hypothetical protein Q8L56_04820 [Rhodocyclaceae bacterium]|nr:hypothetical protein [Rhodocyclaceae bacterium]